MYLSDFFNRRRPGRGGASGNAWGNEWSGGMNSGFDKPQSPAPMMGGALPPAPAPLAPTPEQSTPERQPIVGMTGVYPPIRPDNAPVDNASFSNQNRGASVDNASIFGNNNDNAPLGTGENNPQFPAPVVGQPPLGTQPRKMKYNFITGRMEPDNGW
jgi:hypothetical protein